ncbi:MAG: IS1595 family transposase [Myxococcaceae bacterium]
MKSSKSLATLSALTEDGAREHLEAIRWPNGAVCPRCGANEATKMKGKSVRPGVYKCRPCRKPFTVTVGTIFERSHIPLREWLMAFHIVCASKKGVSALQLQRMLGLGSYKSAWFMAHRIRHAIQPQRTPGMLSGVVEADECFVGGKPRPGAPKKPMREQKIPVAVLVERGGNAIAMPMERLTAYNVRKALVHLVSRKSELHTDESSLYKGSSKWFKGGHHTTNHASKEYARREGKRNVHSNSAECFFSLLKRGIVGSFHHVSREHLPRYCDEFSYRWNTRTMEDGERTTAALERTTGRRLTYRPVKARQPGM